MIPLISIVGRPNVGKSTLFNRLLGKKQSIVFSQPGSTRDLIKEDLIINNKKIFLVDSGGFDNDKDHYPTLIKKKILKTIKKSDFIIFLLDGKAGLQNEDREILKIIRGEKKRYVAVINKIDNKRSDENIPEFYKLGIKQFIQIAAEHDRNLSTLREHIENSFKSLDDSILEPNDSIPRVAIVGKPNAGKSTLINSLARENVSIVSEIPGTTRDTVNVKISRGNQNYFFVDTAGLRRKSKISDNVEYYSTSRAVSAIEKSDVVILIIDSQYGPSKQDSKISSLIKKNNKGIVIAINKADLIPSDIKNEKNISEKILESLPEINYAQTILISALKSKNVNKIYTLIDTIHKNLKMKININKLNKFLKALIDKSTAPVNKGRKLKLYYATQTTGTYSSLILFVNFAKGIPNTYKKFIERSIRKEFDISGVSLRVRYRTSRAE
ncbi:MAG: ribosome biogenesis GTPase Der [Thermodesulfobacteriota bacterium]|nr:ribosome biogenesis GTPase Der [Thermodesulfobacteriota bacterium]